MIRDYLRPKDIIGGGSSGEEMYASRLQEEHRERVDATPFPLRMLLRSDTAILRGVGAVAAGVLDHARQRKP